jgi:Excalibur calcium-binding domain
MPAKTTWTRPPDGRRLYEKKRFIFPATALGLAGVLVAIGMSAGASGAQRAPALPVAAPVGSPTTTTDASRAAADTAAADAKAAAEARAAQDAKSAADAKAAQDATAAADAKAAASAAAAPAPLVDTSAGLRDYANCTELNADYPHGVGRSGAVDKVSGGGSPVTTFVRDDALYAANSESDRDGDGIACEKR